LHNKLITVADPYAKTIRITSLQIPVVYKAVLGIIPGLHACPPLLPSHACHPSPPEGGYDFVFHVGVGGCGPLCLEKIGHKSGYNLMDNDGKCAPEIPASETPRHEEEPSGRGDVVHQPTRGFGKGYETFAEELSTPLDLQSLMHSLKLSRIEVSSSLLVSLGRCTPVTTSP
jgi:pyroglutamyl-peptidase